jgi:hypothetical protein
MRVLALKGGISLRDAERTMRSNQRSRALIHRRAARGCAGMHRLVTEAALRRATQPKLLK